jgi:hypothetical protein
MSLSQQVKDFLSVAPASWIPPRKLITTKLREPIKGCPQLNVYPLNQVLEISMDGAPFYQPNTICRLTDSDFQFTMVYVPGRGPIEVYVIKDQSTAYVFEDQVEAFAFLYTIKPYELTQLDGDPTYEWAQFRSHLAPVPA